MVGQMRETYLVTRDWLDRGDLRVSVEQTCELGSRFVILTIEEVIMNAANRHIQRMSSRGIPWRIPYRG